MYKMLCLPRPRFSGGIITDNIYVPLVVSDWKELGKASMVAEATNSEEDAKAARNRGKNQEDPTEQRSQKHEK